MVNYEIEIRKHILNSVPGKVVTLPIGHLEPAVARERAKSFARLKKVPIEILKSDTDLSFRRLTEAEATATTYSAMDALEIGGSHLFEVPAPHHQRVRMAATARNRQGDVLLSCTREGSAIRVTRHPLKPAEIAAHGLLPIAARPSKYGLERLATESEIILAPATPAELRNMRVAASTKAINEGWKVVCRKLEDGRLKITRHRDEEARHV